MYDFQKTVLIETRPTMGNLVFRYLTLVLAVLGLLAFVLVSPALFLIPEILLVILWWRVWFHSGVEYEYAYFAGDLDFDKIKDKRKRKSVISLNMENVTQIAPAGDRSLSHAHQEANMKFMDLSSRKPGRRFYEVVSREEDKAVCIRFEPDDQFLDSICVKYAQKVIR